MNLIKPIVISVILICAPATAQPATNPNYIQFLRDACHADGTTGLAHYCLGFIEGAGQMMAINGSAHSPEFSMCPPGGQIPTGGAMIQSFLTWADKHPEAWAQQALAGVYLALARTWPCPKSN
jgi:hypothetical protein